MRDLTDLIRDYRLTADQDEKVRLAGDVISVVGHKMYLFLFARAPKEAADLRQEVFAAIALGLSKFKGDSEPEFWGWCYQIARHTISKHFRDEDSEHFVPFDPQEVTRLLDASAVDNGFGVGEKLQLDEAMGMLKEAKPECFHLLWDHFIVGLNYAEIAADSSLAYDNVRVKIGRCLDYTQSLLG